MCVVVGVGIIPGSSFQGQQLRRRAFGLSPYGEARSLHHGSQGEPTLAVRYGLISGEA